MFKISALQTNHRFLQMKPQKRKNIAESIVKMEKCEAINVQARSFLESSRGLKNARPSRGRRSCSWGGYTRHRRAHIKNIFRGPARAAAGWTLVLIYQARSILFRRLRLFGNHPERPSTSFLLFLTTTTLSNISKLEPREDEDKPHVDITWKIRGVSLYRCDFYLIILPSIPPFGSYSLRNPLLSRFSAGF